MTTRRPRDLTDTVGLLVEAAGYVREQVTADIERGTGLPPAWFETLIRLRRTPGQNARITEMAARIGFPQSSFSRLVDQMETAGLIERTPDPTHRRATLIRATAVGAKRLDDALSTYLDSSHRHVADILTDDDLDHLERITRKLHSANLPARPAGTA